MKKFFNTLQKDTVLVWSFWMTIIIFILSIAVIALSYTTLPPYIPLYNHMPWGYERLGKTYDLFTLPLITLCIGVCNTFVGMTFLGKNTLLARFLFITMVGIALFTLIFIVRLVFNTL